MAREVSTPVIQNSQSKADTFAESAGHAEMDRDSDISLGHLPAYLHSRPVTGPANWWTRRSRVK
jgi:hypothetical protein